MVEAKRNNVSELRQQKDAERKARTRRAVLEAAKVVFARQGYHNTKISDIVREAGVGQGTLYRSFTNKRHVFSTLFEELVESLVGEFAEMSARQPGDVAEYREASVRAVTRMTRGIEQNRELMLLFLREGPSIDREFEELMDGVLDRFAAVARFHLHRAIAGGFARPCDADLVAQSVVGMGLRQLERWLSGRLGVVDLEAAVRELVDFCFWGFGPRDEQRSEG